MVKKFLTDSTNLNKRNLWQQQESQAANVVHSVIHFMTLNGPFQLYELPSYCEI